MTGPAPDGPTSGETPPGAPVTGEPAPDAAWPPRGLLIDLDGVVYEGERVLPGAPEFFRFLRERRGVAA